MKNKISNTSKKVIRHVALAAGLVVAGLPGKSKADLLNFNADVNVLGLTSASVGANIGNGISAYAGANALGIGGSTGVSVGNGSLVDVNADANVGPLAGVNAGVNVGNGVNAYVGGNVLGAAGSTGLSVASTGTGAYAYPTYRGIYTTTPTRPVSYASTMVAQPRFSYMTTTQPVRYVTDPDVVYQSIQPRVSAYRLGSVAYQTAHAARSSEIVVKESYDAYSHETANSEVSQQVWQRSEDNPFKGYRSNEIHSRKITKTRRVYYTYE